MATKHPPAKKTPAQREQERRLTDTYAAEGRRDELLKGDELTELEPVGKKGAAEPRSKRPSPR